MYAILYICIFSGKTEPWKGRSLNSIRTEPIRQRHRNSYDDTTASCGCVVNYNFPTFFFLSPMSKIKNPLIPPRTLKKHISWQNNVIYQFLIKKWKKKWKIYHETKQHVHCIEPSNNKSSYQLSVTLSSQLRFDVFSLKIAINLLQIEWFGHFYA
jgi:hypothetical protein